MTDVLPVFSILDLDAFKHGDSIEKILEDFDLDMVETDCQLVPADDDTVSTCSSLLSDTPSVPPSSSLLSAQVPQLAEVLPTYDPVDKTPPVLKALNRLSYDLQVREVSLVDYYYKI